MSPFWSQISYLVGDSKAINFAAGLFVGDTLPEITDTLRVKLINASEWEINTSNKINI